MKRMKRTSRISLVLIVSLSLLVACSNEKDKPSASSEPHSQHASTGAEDIREETGKLDVLPAFLTDKPKEIQEIYQAAAKIKSCWKKFRVIAVAVNQLTIKTITTVLYMKIKMADPLYGTIMEPNAMYVYKLQLSR